MKQPCEEILWLYYESMIYFMHCFSKKKNLKYIPIGAESLMPHDIANNLCNFPP